jgi:hypothetical protein
MRFCGHNSTAHSSAFESRFSLTTYTQSKNLMVKSISCPRFETFSSSRFISSEPHRNQRPPHPAQARAHFQSSIKEAPNMHEAHYNFSVLSYVKGMYGYHVCVHIFVLLLLAVCIGVSCGIRHSCPPRYQLTYILDFIVIKWCAHELCGVCSKRWLSSLGNHIRCTIISYYASVSLKNLLIEGTVSSSV